MIVVDGFGGNLSGTFNPHLSMDSVKDETQKLIFFKISRKVTEKLIRYLKQLMWRQRVLRE
jgi:hypothetical protein